MPDLLIMKIQDGGGRHVELRKTSVSLDSTKFGGQMHHSHMEMSAGILMTLLTTAGWLPA